jgi:hypothetical protein
VKEVISAAIGASPWLVVPAALWSAPDWVLKWLDVRDRWRGR